METIQGQVKWFDPKKGYGFILGPQGQDVFVHYSQIQGDGFRSLRDGEAVEYELVEGDKGFQARGVIRDQQPQPQQERTDRGYPQEPAEAPRVQSGGYARRTYP